LALSLNCTWYCSVPPVRMIQQGGGIILNVIATFAWTGAPRGVALVFSAKAGVLAMTRNPSRPTGGAYGIRVNAIRLVSCHLSPKNFFSITKKRMIESVSKIPLNRFCTLEDISDLAAFSARTRQHTSTVTSSPPDGWKNGAMKRFNDSWSR